MTTYEFTDVPSGEATIAREVSFVAQLYRRFALRPPYLRVKVSLGRGTAGGERTYSHIDNLHLGGEFAQ